MAESPTTLAAEFLGRFVDFLDLDSTEYGKPKNWKGLRLVEWGAGTDRNGVFVPPGLEEYFTPGSYAQKDEEGLVINDASTFQDTMTSKFGVSIGAEGIFTASHTESATTGITNMLRKEKTLMLTRAMGVGPRLEMPDPIPASPVFTFTSRFKNLVDKLPEKDELDNPRSLYQQFITAVGTHYVSSITLGGFAYQYTSVDKTTKTNKQTSDAEIKQAAELKFKIDAGINREQNLQKLAELERTLQISGGTIRWNGGTKDDNLTAWVNSLQEKPSVAECKLTAVTNLLTSRYFTGDSKIDAKRGNLGKRIRQHVKTQGRDSGAIRADLPIGIYSDDGKWALEIDNESRLRFALPSKNDQRQRWLFDGLPNQYIMSVAGWNSSSSGYYLRNVATNQYLAFDANSGDRNLFFEIALRREKNDATLWRVLALPQGSSIPLERPIRESDRLCVLSRHHAVPKDSKDGPKDYQLGAGVANTRDITPRSHVSLRGSSLTIYQKIARQYDALAEFD